MKKVVTEVTCDSCKGPIDVDLETEHLGEHWHIFEKDACSEACLAALAAQGAKDVRTRVLDEYPARKKIVTVISGSEEIVFSYKIVRGAP